MLRMMVVGMLGETGEVAALTPLVVALGDRSQWIRATAIESIRRLRTDGADGVYAAHPVRPALVDALRDRKKPVRLQAACALAEFGELEPVRLRRAATRRDRREFDRVLRR